MEKLLQTQEKLAIQAIKDIKNPKWGLTEEVQDEIIKPEIKIIIETEKALDDLVEFIKNDII